jgi:hypothetical protein
MPVCGVATGQHGAASLASFPSTYARPRVSVTIGSHVEGVGSRLGSCMICIKGISRLCSCLLIIKLRAARVDLILSHVDACEGSAWTRSSEET